MKPRKTRSSDPQPDFAAVTQALENVAVDQIARDSRFVQRTPRKLRPLALVQAACQLALQRSVSLSHWAILIGLAGPTLISKQNVSKRFTSKAVSFMGQVLQGLLQNLFRPPRPLPPEVLAPFGRALLQDSTTARVHPKLSRLFRGGRNQRGRQDGQLKIQATYDLLTEQWVHFSLGDLRCNDQGASADILQLVRPRDLVIRDLGYLVLGVLRALVNKGAFCLSRWRYGLQLFWPDGRPLNLLKELRARGGVFDAQVLVGATEKLPLRLVAIPLTAEQVNSRRRHARATAQRDRRSRLSKERMALLGWSIFLTNVHRSVWTARTVARVYGLRWRVEIVFKAWKSYLQFTHLPTDSAEQLQMLVYARLIFVCLFQLAFAIQEQYLWQSQGPPQRTLSLLKLASFVRNYAWLLIWANPSPKLAQLLQEQISHHCCYEQRKKRANFHQKLRN